MSSWPAVLNGIFWFAVLISIIGTLILPWLAIHIPADYFVRPPVASYFLLKSHSLQLLVLVLRNIVAVVLLVAGVVMLFTPGQGLLMLWAALWSASFPGKFALQRKLITLPGVAAAINKLRQKAGKRALEMPRPQD